MFADRIELNEAPLSDDEAIAIICERLPDLFPEDKPNSSILQVLNLSDESFSYRKWQKQVKKRIKSHRNSSFGQEFRLFHRLAASVKIRKSSILKHVYDIKEQEAKEQQNKFLADNLLEHRKVFTEECRRMESGPLEILRERLLRHFRMFSIVGPTIKDDYDQRQEFKKLFRRTTLLLFRKFRSDSELVLECVRSLCFTERLRQGMYFSCRTGFLLIRCSNLGFDFWGYRSDTAKLSDEFNPVMESFTYGWFKNLPKLTKFGFSYRFNEKHHEKLCEILAELRYERRYVFRVFSALGLVERWKNKRLTMAIQRLILRCRYFVSPSSLVFLSRVSPEPHLTPYEFNNCLKPYVRAWFRPVLQRMAWEYRDANVFPDNYHDYVPRSLQHLSRCTVRQVLGKHCQLPNGVAKLTVPTRVKKYLLLHQ